jgi:hypothetical protein
MASKTILPVAQTSRSSDDEILGLNANTTRRPSRIATTKNAGERSVASIAAATTDDLFGGPESKTKSAKDAPSNSDNATDVTEETGTESTPDRLNQALEGNPELREAWQDAKAYREVFPTPADAQAATRLLGDLNRIDALFYSRRPEDHAELARAVSQLDPQSFASLARAMGELAAKPAETSRIADPARPTNVVRPQDQPRNPDSSKLPAGQSSASGTVAGLTPAQADFFQATNASAVHGVMEAIETQMDRLLPEGISKSARNRVAGEIYRELDTALQGNRALGQQVRDAFRSGALDEAHRRSIVSLVTGRARQALPGVAKRVLNEWTNTIVTANQERRARQRTAERRVDVSGSGGRDGRQAVSSRDIDYGRMSDADILNL